jgi:hypothetical protein
MNVRYRVELSQIERDQLMALPSGGKPRRASSSERRFCWRRMPEPAIGKIARSVGTGPSVASC